MKRPRHWLRWLFLLCVLLVLAEYVTLTWIAPRYAIRAVQQFLGNALQIDSARLALPLTTRLAGIRYRHNSPAAALTIQEAVIRPRRMWVSPRMVEIGTVDIGRPFLRLTRAADGTWQWPALSSSTAAAARARSRRWSPFVSWVLKRWRLRVNTIRIIDGTIELLDTRPSAAFHVVLDHLTINGGPLSFPSGGNEQVSFAVRGLVSGGTTGYAAPVYCSGWMAVGVRDLDVSCQLEPLPLALFDPYFQQSSNIIRVYNTTITSTSQWVAKANRLDARIHLELDHLDEGDISVHGLTIIDIKKLAPNGERRLTAEVSLVGTLNGPEDWRGDVIPGNNPSQRLVAKLLERNIKVVRIPIGGHQVGLHLARASEAAMQDIEAVSKNISDALEILATPIEYQVAEGVSPPLIAPKRLLLITPSTTFTSVAPTAEQPAPVPATEPTAATPSASP